MGDKAVEHFEAVFGVRDVDPELLRLALTHRSYAYENGGIPTNERLEFLGDSVLSLVVTTALYNDHPELPEGQLARLRASVVNMKALATVARRMGAGGIGPHLYLGKGEESSGGRNKNSILADAVEALLGAVYLQYGVETAKRVVHQFFDPLMERAAGQGAALDWKTSLQELTADSGLGVPEYRIAESGPDHAKEFTAWAVVAGEEFGEGTGGSKKDAEQIAAELAWRVLSERLGVKQRLVVAVRFGRAGSSQNGSELRLARRKYAPQSSAYVLVAPHDPCQIRPETTPLDEGRV